MSLSRNTDTGHPTITHADIMMSDLAAEEYRKWKANAKIKKQVWNPVQWDGASLGQIRDEVAALIVDHGPDVRVDVSGDEDGCDINIIAIREETDAEYELRLKHEAHYAEMRRIQELKNLAALKAKYPDAN